MAELGVYSKSPDSYSRALLDHVLELLIMVIPRRYLLLWSERPYKVSLIKNLKTKIPGMSGIHWVFDTFKGHVQNPEQCP